MCFCVCMGLSGCACVRARCLEQTLLHSVHCSLQCLLASPIPPLSTPPPPTPARQDTSSPGFTRALDPWRHFLHRFDKSARSLASSLSRLHRAPDGPSIPRASNSPGPQSFSKVKGGGANRSQDKKGAGPPPSHAGGRPGPLSLSRTLRTPPSQPLLPLDPPLPPRT